MERPVSKDGDGAEAAPFSSEQALRLLVETLPTLVWQAEPEGNIEYVNKRVLDYFGAPLDEITGWGWVDRVHPDDVAFKVKNWLANLETKSPSDVVCRFRGADGQHRWFNVRGEPLRATDGTVLRWYGLLIDVDDKKRAEEALRESEQKLRQIIETVPSLLWSLGPEGEQTRLNQRALDYIGVRFEDLVRLGWQKFLHPDDLAETAKAFSHAIQTGTSYEAVHRIRRADGEYRWHHARGEPLRDEQGRIVQWYGLSVDIDEAKKAEERLRRSEAHLAEAQRLSRIGATAANKSKVLFFSEEAYRIWGFDPTLGIPNFETMAGRLHPDDRDRVLAGVQLAFTEKKGYSHSYRIVLPDGTVKYLDSIGEPVLSASGELVEVVATQIDVTERKRAEQALRDSEYKLRQIIDTVPGLIWSNEPGGEPSHVNQSMLDYSGMQFEDFKQRGWEEFVHPDDFPETVEAFYHAIETGTSYEGVFRLRRADGEFRWHRARCQPLRDQQGRIIQWYGLSVDVDEAKKAEDRLRRSETRLAEAQRLSHTGSAAYNRTEILHWSEESSLIYGFDPALGIPSREAVWQRIHPDDLDRVNENIERGIREKRGYANEFRIVLPDGTVKHIEATNEPMFSASGELLEVVATGIDVTERKTAEDLLRRSEAYLAEAQRLSHTGTWALNTTTMQYLYWSDESYRIWAFDPRDGLPSRDAVWRRIHPDDRDRVWPKIQEAVDRKEDYSGEFRIVLPDRTVKHLAATSHHLFSSTGELVEVIGTNVDVTERKTAEQALRESEYKLRQLMDTVPGLTWSTGQPGFMAQVQAILNVLPAYTWYAAPRGALTFVNTRTAEYLGISDDHPLRFGIDVGAEWDHSFALLHPDDREDAGQYWASRLRTGEGGEHNYRVRGAQGDYRWFHTRMEPLRSSDGTLLLWIGATLDIEELKRAAEGLRESEAKFRDYAESASDWFWEIGPDYKFTLLTENAFGSDASDRIGTACWDHALDLETEPEKWRLLKVTLAARKPFRDFVYHSDRHNGSSIHVKVTGKPVFDVDGEFRGYRGTGTDVTALMLAQEEHERLRQLESDLAHMNRVSVIGELTASLAHEITQPIAAARNNARAAMHFLDRNPPDLDEIREALASIVDDADRAGDIIDRIRDHIRKAPPRKSRFDLNDAIDEVIGLARSAITTNGVTIRTGLAEALVPVEGDRVQLQQVVLNLILNAVEAMSTVEPRRRELLISTEQIQSGGVLVSVRDSGPGIDPEHLERVFQAFYTTKSNGVGMGLSISRSIIDAHGGRLWADKNASRGAAFWFSLPGPGTNLTNSRRSADRTGEPHGDTLSDAAHQKAYEGNKRPHR